MRPIAAVRLRSDAGDGTSHVGGKVAGDGTLTVASMNLHWGFSSTGEPFDVAAAVRSLDADVIALQETWTAKSALGDPAADPLEAVAHGSGARVMRAPLYTVADLAGPGLPGGSGPGHVGNAVLTMLPVTGYQVLGLGVVPGDAVQRIAQVVWLTLRGQAVVRFVNTHLTYRPFSPAQLWRLRRALSGHGGPTVIAGDLNMPPPLAALTSGCLPAVRGRTWPASRPLLQLDHVLVAGGVEPVSGRVLAHGGSDHLPVRAELRLSARHEARTGVLASADRRAG
jgi:endonuclease/exonuclease/phosphatase family metal-dependent hydrolase